MDVPLLEDDSGSPGVIEPWQMAPEGIDMPQRAVLCFFADVLRDIVAVRPEARQVTALTSEAGTSPVWEIELAGKRLAVLQPGVGAPWAAASLDEIVAMGCRRVITCGAAGALTPELVLGHAVVVDSAVRDEGTSYHYLPPDRVVHAAEAPVRSTAKALADAGIPHTVGRSWSTDAIYREARERVRQRVDEGCVVVETTRAPRARIVIPGIFPADSRKR